LFKSWFPGVGRSHNKENHIHIVYIEKKVFSRTSKPIPIKLGTNHPLVMRIKNCTNRGPGPLKKGDNQQNAEIGMGSFKDLLNNHRVRRAQIYMNHVIITSTQVLH
jgi:hypothetical protein